MTIPNLTRPTTPPSPSQIEQVGQAFDPAVFTAVQQETRDALQTIASSIQVGMLEEEAYQMAKEKLRALGFEKNWHRPYIRFGKNTILNFGQHSEPGIRLGENDLFYVDLGPVKGGYEGDAGDTFVVGQDPEMHRCANDTRRLFRELQAAWEEEKITGQELYARAELRSAEWGWQLNTDWAGHRVSEFPHQVHYRGTLAEIAFTPSPGIWVLELHLCDPSRRFGAFFEDWL